MGRTLRSSVLPALAAAIVFVMTAPPSHAQVSAGLSSISGIVRDPAGGVIGGADVVVENGSIGVRLELKTSDGGLFNAPSLQPAAGYDVTVDKPGFAHYEVKDITLSVGQNMNIRSEERRVGKECRYRWWGYQ